MPLLLLQPGSGCPLRPRSFCHPHPAAVAEEGNVVLAEAVRSMESSEPWTAYR